MLCKFKGFSTSICRLQVQRTVYTEGAGNSLDPRGSTCATLGCSPHGSQQVLLCITWYDSPVGCTSGLLPAGFLLSLDNKAVLVEGWKKEGSQDVSLPLSAQVVSGLGQHFLLGCLQPTPDRSAWWLWPLNSNTISLCGQARGDHLLVCFTITCCLHSCSFPV